jgi:hypothetical protein
VSGFATCVHVSTTYCTVVEDKGGASIDGRRTGVGRRIDVLAGMQLQGFELGFSEKRCEMRRGISEAPLLVEVGHQRVAMLEKG